MTHRQVRRTTEVKCLLVEKSGSLGVLSPGWWWLLIELTAARQGEILPSAGAWMEVRESAPFRDSILNEVSFIFTVDSKHNYSAYKNESILWCYICRQRMLIWFILFCLNVSNFGVSNSKKYLPAKPLINKTSDPLSL